MPTSLQQYDKTGMVLFPILAEDSYLEGKKQEIEEVLSSSHVDIDRLREFAISRGGFVTDELRQKAWPLVVGIDVDNIPPKPGECLFTTSFIHSF